MKLQKYIPALAGLLVAPLALHATPIYTAFIPQVLIDYNDPATGFPGSPEPQGNDTFYFTVNAPIIATALGYTPGLLDKGDEVALYDVTSGYLLLAQADFTSSELPPPVSGIQDFLYEAIAPQVLLPGHMYAVDTFYPQPPENYLLNYSVGAAPEINFFGYAYDYNASIDAAANGYPQPEIGPDFQFTAVPDCGMSVALLGLSLGGTRGSKKTCAKN